MAEQDEEDAEVEQRAAQPQQPVLVQLGGPRGPAELVVAVPPHSARRRTRSGRCRARRPTGRRPGRAHDPAPLGSLSTSAAGGGPAASARACTPVGRTGRGPPPRSGGPSAASRSTASRSLPRSGGSVAQTACATRRPGRARVGQGQPQQLHAGPVVQQQLARPPSGPRSRRTPARRQVVGQLLVGELHAGGPVGRLEPQQRHAAPPGVAVLVVGEVEAAASLVVEGLDVGRLPARAAVSTSGGGGRRRADPPRASGSRRAAAATRGTRARSASSG